MFDIIMNSTYFADVELYCRVGFGSNPYFGTLKLSCIPSIPGTNITFVTCSIDGAPPTQCEL